MTITANQVTVEDFQALGIVYEPTCWNQPKFRCSGPCDDIWPIRDQHLTKRARYCPVCAPPHAVKSAELQVASR